MKIVPRPPYVKDSDDVNNFPEVHNRYIDYIETLFDYVTTLSDELAKLRSEVQQRKHIK